ncbi:4-(cytidine 5'-diphospho)-2-C-methyl-D-erythritol kinase [Maridesulfovibrio hydrothermalis]|uniref:4-diphosphocytidyl-2-C-methyl-D-erythritol kinase n=1 Tax=Maridesulfovibrio hydrothermalis AM13 = DSM 14728 TaxID=1121451 RepID=L0RGQ8_9BACT|nr:4-(cytidine 5'-diphospho)-2-C-methyl-D-erythritol kinase [Maridesulfovibrio hydrothermalis]CCO25400.1 4-diphosphocytidyl-2-C-methyl-D-erythritol kinase [Maridesulfovibrio hydrothermalis AM13 = DSM 14728]
MKNSATILTAPAKVNLYLKIVKKRDDGYHELDTLFHPFPALADTLEVTEKTDGCTIHCTDFNLPVEENIIYKAWDKYAQATGFRPGLHIELIKKTPTGAGLGGGSSDAASMLRYLNSHPDSPGMEHGRLNALAAGLGADVPFFLQSGPAWAKGIGEILTPCEVDLSGLTALLACPDVHVNTAWAYKEWSRQKGSNFLQENDSFCLTTSASGNNKSASKTRVTLFNDFEQVVLPEFSQIRKTKEYLLENGACGAVMSGSGASVISFFRDKSTAEKIANDLKSSKVDSVIHTF